MRRRSHEGWYQTRFLGYCMMAPWTKNVTPESLISFPWEKDKKQEKKNENAAAVAALIKRAKEYESKLNNQSDGK